MVPDLPARRRTRWRSGRRARRRRSCRCGWSLAGSPPRGRSVRCSTRRPIRSMSSGIPGAGHDSLDPDHVVVQSDATASTTWPGVTPAASRATQVAWRMSSVPPRWEPGSHPASRRVSGALSVAARPRVEQVLEAVAVRDVDDGRAGARGQPGSDIPAASGIDQIALGAADQVGGTDLGVDQVGEARVGGTIEQGVGVGEDDRATRTEPGGAGPGVEPARVGDPAQLDHHLVGGLVALGGAVRERRRTRRPASSRRSRWTARSCHR